MEKVGEEFKQARKELKPLTRELRDDFGRLRRGACINPRGTNGITSGAKLARELAYAAIPRAFSVLYSMMDNEDMAPQYRLTATQILLAYGAGKPVQFAEAPEANIVDAATMTGQELEIAMLEVRQAREEFGALNTVKEIVDEGVIQYAVQKKEEERA